MPAKTTKLTDPYIEAGAVKQGLGRGVLHDLKVSHGASYAAFVFGGTKDDAMAYIDAMRTRLGMEPDQEPYGPAVTFPCGLTTAIQTRDDFPSETLAAPCGHPEHFVVYFVAPS